jgi:hypothetical protein
LSAHLDFGQKRTERTEISYEKLHVHRVHRNCFDLERLCILWGVKWGRGNGWLSKHNNQAQSIVNLPVQDISTYKRSIIIDFASVVNVCVKCAMCSVYNFEKHVENIRFFSLSGN